MLIKTIIKIAVRNMLKNRFYTFINIFGLSLGLASCLIIFIFIKNELSYDRFHPDADLIYRANSSIKISGQYTEVPLTSRLLAPALRDHFPEVQNSLRVETSQAEMVIYEEEKGGKAVKEDFFLIVDEHFFEFFHFPLKVGDPSGVLQDSSSIVLTEASARKIFGNKAALSSLIGERLLVGEEEKTFRISGIAANPPENSHIRFGMLVPGSSNPANKDTKWSSFQVYTYLKVKDSLGGQEQLVQDFEKRLQSFIHQHMEADMQEVISRSMEEFVAEGNSLETHLIPMLDIHLKSQLADEIMPGGNILYLYLFGASSLFIVLLACVNFMNLATARSANRAKEIGVRKVLGSRRSHLVFQFLIEGVLYSSLALLLAFAMVDLALPFFSQLSGRMLMPLYNDPFVIVFSIVLSVLVGLISGTYPAFYLTHFEPAQVLKGQQALGAKSSKLRNLLVIFQFAVSIMLIAGTLLVFKQLNFLQQQPLGFEKQNLLVVKNAENLGKHSKAFKEEVKGLPGVVNAAFSSNMPGDYMMNASTFRTADKSLGTTISILSADKDFLETLGTSMLVGESFKGLPADTASLIINEAAASYIKGGASQGQQMEVFIKSDPTFNVVGVVKDFNFKSLDKNITPLGIILAETGELMSVRLSEDQSGQLKAIEEIWARLLPGVPFEYYFVEDRYEELSRSEQQMSRIMTIFTCLAIIIACLGLLGLAAFTAEQRRKEIGIRKALGSSVNEVVMLLSKDFLKLVFIAFFIGAPLAYFAMDHWLDNFAYRISVGIGVFLISGLLALLIACLTVSYQSFKAALADPVESLKDE